MKIEGQDLGGGGKEGRERGEWGRHVIQRVALCLPLTPLLPDSCPPSPHSFHQGEKRRLLWRHDQGYITQAVVNCFNRIAYCQNNKDTCNMYVPTTFSLLVFYLCNIINATKSAFYYEHTSYYVMS